MFSALRKFFSSKHRASSPGQAAFGQYLSAEDVQRMIDEGERLNPTSEEERARLPKLSPAEVEELVRLADKITVDPEFQRRLRDQTSDKEEA